MNVLDAWIVKVQPVARNAAKTGIVQHDDRVSIIDKALHSQDRVVRLNYNVRVVGHVRKHRVRLDKLFWVRVVQRLQQMRTQARTSTARNTVQQSKPLRHA